MASKREELENELQIVRFEYQTRHKQVWDNAYYQNATTLDDGASARRAGNNALADDYTLKTLSRRIEELEKQLAKLPGKPDSFKDFSSKQTSAVSPEPSRQKSRKQKSSGATAESLTKRGFIFLEESEWDKAFEYFDDALDINPEYAKAYIGLLCVELKIKSEDGLIKHDKSITGMTHYKDAKKYADAEYKTILKDIEVRQKHAMDKVKADKENRKRIAEKKRNDRYLQLVNNVNDAKINVSPSSVFKSLKKQLLGIRDYKNVNDLIALCDKLAKSRENYEQLIRSKNDGELKNSNSSYFHDLADKFRKISGEYEDAGRLADECDAIAQNEKTAEMEREREKKYNDILSIVDLYKKRIQRSYSDSDAEQLEKLTRELRSLGYKDTERLFNECTLLIQRGRAEQQKETWISQGLCPDHGGQLVGIWSKSYECCGKKR
jgi:tetratricopeptide (TPR) repeat protein